MYSKLLANVNDDDCFCMLIDIVIGMDNKVMQLCQDANITNCIQATQHNFGASDYMLNEFYDISYFRWDVIATAQKYFKYVFFVDADILLLQNPWFYMQPIHFQKCDIICQIENRSLGDCNSGQMVLKGTAMSQLIAQDILSYRQSGLYDQHIFNEIFRENQVMACLLDQDRYIGHSLNPTTARILDLVTYHATGVTGVNKYKIMKKVLLYVESALNNSVPNDRLVYNQAKGHLYFPYCIPSDDDDCSKR